jgi:hypothetical protein
LFDLYSYPLGIRQKQEYTNISGYFVGTAPRRSARTREEDILVFQFSPYRKLKEDEQNALLAFLEKTSDFYFKTNGPITTVSKRCGEFLNDLLLKFNGSRPISEIISGSLQFLVLHGDEAYFVHCGNISSFVISKTRSAQFNERASGSQGLGLSNALRFKFFHAELQNGDRILLCNLVPSNLTIDTLTEEPRISISHLRNTLLRQANQDFEAIILQVRTGTGNIHQLKLENQSIVTPTEIESFDRPLAAENAGENRAEQEPAVYSPQGTKEQDILQESQAVEKLEAYTKDQIPVPPFLLDSMPVLEKPTPPAQYDKKIESAAMNNRQTQPLNLSAKRERQRLQMESEQKATQSVAKADQSLMQPGKPIIDRSGAIRVLTSIKTFLAKAIHNSEKINATISTNTAKLISRTNPGSRDFSTSLSTTSMFFITILVPILVVAISMTVYFRSGRTEQHDKFVLQANQLITSASTESDISKRIVIYQDALLFLDEAEKYGTTQASEELRNIIQDDLDTLQGVTRISLQSTVPGGLDRRIQIHRMVIGNGEDIYALDQGTGRVLRLVHTNNDYEVDTSFVCGPGNYEQTLVYDLVDIDSVSVNNSLNAVVIGIDNGGNLLICSVNREPIAITINPPELGWGKIQAIAFNNYSLYILDVDEKTRDLYRLPANKMAFDENPESVFSGNIPDILTSFIDMAVYDDQLFLLQDNGELMNCSIGVANINCVPNIGYGYIQEGQDRKTVETVAGVNFTQVQTTQPPDPSIYFMDSLNKAVYHYSLALNMQKQIRPNFIGSLSKPEGSLTAFTVSPLGVLHLAYGSQLYFGYLP